MAQQISPRGSPAEPGLRLHCGELGAARSALSFRPDGRGVAVGTRLTPAPPQRYALDILTLDGRLEQRFVDDLPFYPVETAWAPDGRRIAVAFGDGAVAVVDLETGTVTPLASGAPQTSAQLGGWATDGRTLVFARTPWLGVGSVLTSDTVTLGTQTIAHGRRPVVSPDGSRVAFLSSDGLAVVPLAGGDPAVVDSRADNPAWSPDGTALAYESGLPFEGHWPDLAVSDIRATPVLRWKLPLGPSEGVAWRSTGIFTGVDGEDIDSHGLQRIDSTTGHRTGLPAGSGSHFFDAASPAGTVIAYRTHVGGGETVLRLLAVRTRGFRGLPCAGSAGADDRTSTPGPDVVDGFGGGDRIAARGGADLIRPGRGRDIVDAGAGDDVIEARDGERDVVLCGAGMDVVVADRGDRLARGCERVR
jgi:Ca2+-binding RTX toxin-like protein